MKEKVLILFLECVDIGNDKKNIFICIIVLFNRIVFEISAKSILHIYIF